jgi:hypothetical protein
MRTVRLRDGKAEETVLFVTERRELTGDGALPPENLTILCGDRLG